MKKSITPFMPDAPLASGGDGMDDRNVLQVARKLAATIGADFFKVIAIHLAKALKAECVLIGEFAGGQVERVRTLGACMDGDPASFEYALAGSASAPVALGKPSICRADVQTRYPSDTFLPQVRAQACIGVPLLDAGGEALGLMMAAYRRPIGEVRSARKMLEVFAARAAAELTRKREEDRLRETEQRYRVFIARNPDAMWRIEFEQPIPLSLPEEEQLERIHKYGYLAECNDALARMVGAERAAPLIGSRVQDLVPISDPSGRDATLLSIRSGYRFTTAETHPVDASGNQRHFLRSQWGIVEDGVLERVWGVSRDITDLKRSELKRDAAERRWAELIEHMPLAAVIVDMDGEIAACNKSFFDATGWHPDQLCGKPWIETLIGPDEQGTVRELLAGDPDETCSPAHFECAIVTAEGRRLQFTWDRVLLRNENDMPSAWANLGRDVTEQREQEEHFRQSQKLASIGRVSGGVAHDFNNLLTVILGYSAALLKELEPSDKSYAGLAEIRNAASKGADLTHRLLAFSRRQVLQPEVLNMNNLVEEADHVLRHLVGDDIRITSHRDPSLWLARVDRASFHHVLLNLAANARDAMPNGGEISINTGNLKVGLHGSFAASVPPGEYVHITFADTGIGMTETVRGHLFEPFFTTKEYGKGTGLGLSTVYGTVQQSGGTIIVETATGKGTRFHIFFPRVRLKLAPSGEAGGESAETQAQGSESILLVDDRDDVRRVTAAMLSGLGYSVLQTESPERALELVQDRSKTVHLLLTDVMMPGMGGFELAHLARTYQPRMRVLFMSGNLDAAAEAGQLTEPGIAYLQKPFTPERLGSSVRQLLKAS